jgi:alpha-beta hydrolase superfamily lysophospholipase
MKQPVMQLGTVVWLALAWTVPARAAEPDSPFLLHVPGVGGHLRVDDLLTQGLRQGGLDAQVQIYDWTGGNPGYAALAAYERNQRQAQAIADVLVRVRRASPARRIIVTSHSGGAGLAVWALERLPDDVHVDTLLLLAPALSPQYDLTRALRRVKGAAYAFTSDMDPVLGVGTRTFGTIDRVKTESAGRVGFTRPQGADPIQYDKLMTFAYDLAWLSLGNAGDHIGTMNRPFARRVLAPLLLTGELPRIAPASQPATRAAGA